MFKKKVVFLITGLLTALFAEDVVPFKQLPLSSSQLYLCGILDGVGFYYANGLLVKIPEAPLGIKKISIFNDSVYFILEYSSIESSAEYWCNGFRQEIDSQKNYFISDQFICKKGVFIAGAVRDSTITSCYWQNGNKKYLAMPDYAHYCIGQTIIEHNGTVYTGGVAEYKACAWINDSALQLSDSNGACISAHIFKDDICIAGYDRIHIEQDYSLQCGWYWYKNKKTYIRYWGDSTENDPNWYLNTRCFFSNNTNLFAVGSGQFYPLVWFLWKDGKAVQLEDTSVEGEEYHAVAEHNGKLVLAGKYKEGNADSKDRLCLWIDDKRYTISEPAANIQIYSIVLTDNKGINNTIFKGKKQTSRKTALLINGVGASVGKKTGNKNAILNLSGRHVNSPFSQQILVEKRK